MRTPQVSLVRALCLALPLSAFASDAHLNQLPPISYSQIAKLIAPDGQISDQYGNSAAIDGSTIVVGKAFSQFNTAFVYEDNSGTVTQVAELTPSDGVAGDRFGYAVAISGNTIIVSSSEHVNHDPKNVGSIYVFVKPADGWANMTETAELSFGQAGASISRYIGISGNTVVAVNSGYQEALIWVEPSSGWISTSKPNAELLNTNLATLTSVAISGNVIVVGAPEAYDFFGAAFVYVKPAGGWNKIGITETARLIGSDAGGGGGETVAIGGNTIVSLGNQGPITGAYVFVKPGTGWVNANQNAFLGIDCNAAAVSGNTIVLGYPNQLVGVNPGQGAAFVFTKPPAGWTNTSTANAELVASDGQPDDALGLSVGVSGTTVVAGAPLATIGSNTSEGAAYVFAAQ